MQGSLGFLRFSVLRRHRTLWLGLLEIEQIQWSCLEEAIPALMHKRGCVVSYPIWETMSPVDQMSRAANTRLECGKGTRKMAIESTK